MPKPIEIKGAGKPAQLFYVVYRTGSPENCQWNRTEPMTKSEAEKQSSGFEKALVVDKKLSDAIGLPEGWEYVSTRR